MARTGRGWDAKPPDPRRAANRRRGEAQASGDPEPNEPASDRRRTSLPWSAAPSAERAGGVGGERGGGRGAGSRDTKSGDTPEVQDDYELAREICLKQLSTRPRTRSELASAMKKRGVPQEVASAVLDRYNEVGMIDDAAFARAWVSSRHHSKGLAGRALVQELRQKGVDQEVAQEALSELEPETEAQTALALAMRKLRSTRGEPEAVFRRLLGMLARKGYSGGVAVRAVKEALATRDSELADQIDPDVYEE